MQIILIIDTTYRN